MCCPRRTVQPAPGCLVTAGVASRERSKGTLEPFIAPAHLQHTFHRFSAVHQPFAGRVGRLSSCLPPLTPPKRRPPSAPSATHHGLWPPLFANRPHRRAGPGTVTPSTPVTSETGYDLLHPMDRRPPCQTAEKERHMTEQNARPEAGKCASCRRSTSIAPSWSVHERHRRATQPGWTWSRRCAPPTTITVIAASRC